MTTDAFTTAGPHCTNHAPGTPNPVFISVADVMFGTAAAPVTSARWFDTLRARFLRPRTHPARRADYLENAAMAREMHRL
jgi:hypothetical protein